MESWWIIPLFLTLLLSFTLRHILFRPKTHNLPPGPPFIPGLSTIYWFSKDIFANIKPILGDLRSKHGPILTLRVTSQPIIFVSDRALAHRALVHHGAIFADRPSASSPNRILRSKRITITTARYGPLWRSLRRTLSSEVLHPSGIKHFADARKWVLNVLFDELKAQADSNNGVVFVMECFHFAMFSLLVLMCFGEKLDVERIREIEEVQKALNRSLVEFGVFAVFPRITKLVFRRRWKMLLDVRKRRDEIFGPLIKKTGTCSYVDSLIELSSIAEEGGRKLTEGDMVSLCSELLTAGADTTATALEWIMAELVKHPEMQKKLSEEILDNDNIKEEDFSKMLYLKAVIMEGLRRHPPTHILIPHAVTEDVELGGYVVPKGTSVFFHAAEMGWDGNLWGEPMEFRPERFLAGGEGEGVDISGSREIKMMPFGAGRRICPGLGLAMLHLEYFVANLVREFEWRAVDGEEVDLSEKRQFTVVMKNPLRARIVRRGAEKMIIQCCP